MKKLTALFFLFCYSVTAQDTIHFRNGEESAAKVYEITETEIKYNRYDNPSGPSYVAAITEVKSIKYKNGMIDAFTFIKADAEQETPAYVNNLYSENSFQKIGIRGKTLSYDHRGVNNAKLFELIQNHADKDTKDVLTREFNLVTQYKRNHGTGLAVVFGGIVGSLISLGLTDDIGAAGFFLGTGISITGAIMANINRNKHNAQRVKVAKMYNGEQFDFR